MKIKSTKIPELRNQLLEAQKYDCAVCGLTLKGHVANLDHNHTTGIIRGVIHRECNILLGKIENYANTFGSKTLDLDKFLKGVVEYLHKHRMEPTEWIHPTHLTPEERKERKNLRARTKRALMRSKK